MRRHLSAVRLLRFESSTVSFVPSSSWLQGIKETALHLAVRLEEKSSLALVDFLCQNRSDGKKFVHHLHARTREASLAR